MDIQPTMMGAVADVTDDAVDTVLEMLAEALHRDPIRAELLLFELRDAAETRGKFLDLQASGRIVSAEMMTEVSVDVDAARDALRGLLVGRVLVSMAATTCVKRGAELIAAGTQAQERFRTPNQLTALPGQPDRGAA